MLCASLCGLLAVGPTPAPAQAQATAQVRATLTWDTDDTDIDLHVWSPAGEHAWYREQTGIPSAQLSTDITSGFGPERMEDFAADRPRTFTYGLCYFAANLDDESVPETVATVQIAEPDGTVRTLRRRLRAEGDAFLLGSSPGSAADAFVPPDASWCRGATSVHPPGDDGGVGQEGDGGGSPSAPFEGCTRTRRRLGVVEVCADAISGDGPRYRVSGDVRLNGAVAVGGPLTIDTTTEHIVSDEVVGISVVRAGGLVPVGTGVLDVDSAATRDAVSGRDGLADLRLSEARLASLSLADLPVVAPQAGSQLSMYLDGRDGGGVVVPARIALPFAGATSQGEVAVGIHATPAAGLRLLGGGVRFGAFDLGAGWKLSGLTLAHASASDTWTASGGIVTPVVGLDVSGQLVRGRLGALSAAATRDVPLGQTGFVLSSVRGSVEGLAQPPLRLALTASGRWGSVPGAASVAVVHLEGVRLEVGPDGTATLEGQASFVRRDGSPVTGDLRMTLAVDPFVGRGALRARIRLPGVDLRARTAATMSARRFTAAGDVSGRVRGLAAAGGHGIVSDHGVAAFSDVCVGVRGRCGVRTAIGFGLDWNDLPSLPRWVGADVGRSATVAGRRLPTVRVARGRPLLFVDATNGPGGPLPRLRVRSPSGRVYATGADRADTTVVRDRQQGYVGLTVLRPQPGRWRVLSAGAGTPRVVAQAVRRMQRVRALRLRPASTRGRPLRRARGAVTLRWSSRGLPPGTTVDVHASADPRTLGRRLARGKRPAGGLRIRARALRPGRNRFTLVVRRTGAVIDQTRSPDSAWVR